MRILPYALSQNPLIWVMALLKRAGNRARGKTAGKRARGKNKLITNAGTNAEVQGEVVGSLSQVLADGSHRVPSWISDDIASYRKQRRAFMVQLVKTASPITWRGWWRSGGRGAVLFDSPAELHRELPQRQIGVEDMGEHGFAMRRADKHP